ncbi:MAG: hypothetical protein KA436_06430 [Oligoflexales bacterium]|nr:hypothetical protein [Oligoflexales bacterium]
MILNYSKILSSIPFSHCSHLFVFLLIYTLSIENIRAEEFKSLYFKQSKDSELTKTIHIGESKRFSFRNFYHEKNRLQHQIQALLGREFEVKLHYRDETIQLDFNFAGIPLCQNHVNISPTSNDNFSFIGNPPQIHLPKLSKKIKWPDPESSLLVLKTYTRREQLEAETVERCLLIEDKKLLAALNFKFQIDGLPYEATVQEGQIKSINPLFFAIDAKISVFKNNEQGLNIETSTVPVLTSNLMNSFFDTDTTSNPDKAFARSSSSTFNFSYELKDSRFHEASAFVYANQAYNFFESMGFKWNTKPITLVIFQGHETNQAYYQPYSKIHKGPIISLGEGDGISQRSFCLDSDVITHEFSHHFIGQYISGSSEQGSVLHEGIADYFAYEKADNSCLAERVRVESTEDKPICLRKGDNKVQYKDETYKDAEFHTKSLAISGLLWDLRKKLGPLTKPLVFNGIKRLSIYSGFSQFFEALIISDRTLFAGENSCSILESIQARGFQEFTSNINCLEKEVPQTSPTDPAPDQADPSPKKKQPTKNPCSSTSIYIKTKSTVPDYIIIITPLLLILRRKRKLSP